MRSLQPQGLFAGYRVSGGPCAAPMTTAPPGHQSRARGGFARMEAKHPAESKRPREERREHETALQARVEDDEVQRHPRSP